MLEFDGKVAIVTGAGQGLGRAHALHLASLGARVVVNDVGETADATTEAIVSAGGQAISVRSNVATWDGAATIVDTAVRVYRDLHIVVNNAGFLRDAMSFTMEEEPFDSVVAVHLKGHFLMTRHASAYFRERVKAGVEVPRRIINTSSESGIFGGPGQSNYGAAKGAIVALTYITAKELGRVGVTVNAIAPRARTAMTESNPRFARPDEGFDKYEPSHISRVVAWLAQDSMSDVSGQVFICAGATVHLLQPPTVAASVINDGAWTMAALNARKDELFREVPRTIPSWAGPN